MFGSVFLKTLRDLRTGILVFGLGLGLYLAVVVWEYAQFTKEQLDQFVGAYRAFGFVLGEYIDIGSLGGFLTMEVRSWLIILLSVWAGTMAVGLLRGEEERGSMDVLMSAPRGRMAIFWQKLAALAVALLAGMLLIYLLFYATLWLTGQSIPTSSVASEALNQVTMAAFWAATGLFIGQFLVVRRSASILTGSLVAITFLLSGIAQTVPSLDALKWFLPYHYYDVSKPLAPDHFLKFDMVAVLAVGAVVLVAVSAWIFSRRDMGRSAFSPARPLSPLRRRRGSPVMLGSVLAKNLRDQAAPAFWWAFGMAVYAAVLVATTTEALAPMYRAMESMPLFKAVFGDIAGNESYLSMGLFLYLPLLLAAYVLTVVWGWAGDEEDGRMELLATGPVPRWQLVVARFVSGLAGLALILAATGASVIVTGQLSGVELDSAKIWDGVIACVPVVLVVLALGLALATWLPRPGPAVGITTTAVVLMYLLDLLAPIFNWPETARNFSLFHYYGKPVMEGILWGNMLALLGVTAVLLAGGVAAFARHDISH